MTRSLVEFGLTALLVLALWPVLARFGFGRLPGDIVIQRRSFRLLLPITTAVVLSVVLSAVIWLVGR